jgi:hypothetical protein
MHPVKANRINPGDMPQPHDQSGAESTRTSAGSSRRLPSVEGLEPRRRSGGAAAPRRARADRNEQLQAQARGDAQPVSILGRAVRLAQSSAGTLARFYVGAAAVAAAAGGYGAYRYASNRMADSSAGPSGLAPLPQANHLGPAAAMLIDRALGDVPGDPAVDLATLHQARDEVLARYGAFIPQDSPCHDVQPRLSVVNSATHPDRIGEAELSHGDLHATSVAVDPRMSRRMGASVAHHEFVHCYAHPDFNQVLASSADISIMEGLTEYFSVPLGPAGIDLSRVLPGDPMTNGKTVIDALAELEQKAGKKTLKLAYFSGNPAAIARVTDAISKVWPKVPSRLAWMYNKAHPNPVLKRAFAEYFVGATLIYTGKLPDDTVLGPAGDVLPVAHFTDITTQQAHKLRRQAQGLRDRIGAEKFEQVFCNLRPDQQRQRMQEVESDIAPGWKPVFQLGGPGFVKLE